MHMQTFIFQCKFEPQPLMTVKPESTEESVQGHEKYQRAFFLGLIKDYKS